VRIYIYLFTQTPAFVFFFFLFLFFIQDLALLREARDTHAPNATLLSLCFVSHKYMYIIIETPHLYISLRKHFTPLFRTLRYYARRARATHTHTHMYIIILMYIYTIYIYINATISYFEFRTLRCYARLARNTRHQNNLLSLSSSQSYIYVIIHICIYLFTQTPPFLSFSCYLSSFFEFRTLRCYARRARATHLLREPLSGSVG